ncbi:hypothetical protein NL533_35490, partial [Klebsiella pneumoniae]|nr:hypothetical protein [Klebsiella pneumoniae]
VARIEEFDGVAIGIGNNWVRFDLLGLLLASGASLPAIRHPAASISPTAETGAGSAILAGAVVVTGAVIGKACIVNTSAT